MIKLLLHCLALYVSITVTDKRKVGFRSVYACFSACFHGKMLRNIHLNLDVSFDHFDANLTVCPISVAPLTHGSFSEQFPILRLRY